MDDATVAGIVSEMDDNFQNAAKHANHLLTLIKEMLALCQPSIGDTVDVTVFKHALTSMMIQSLERLV